MPGEEVSACAADDASALFVPIQLGILLDV